MFIVRVQLHGSPAWADYDNLHKAMEAAGYSRTIYGDDGQRWALPHAMYVLNGSSTARTVCDHAKTIADRVWIGGSEVFVSETTIWAGAGLSRA